MKYHGIELVPVTKSQIFDPPRKMLVWDDSFAEPRTALVWGIAPASANNDYPVHCADDSYYKYCAEIPQTKPKRATVIQLAEWLAKGNGMWKRAADDAIFMSLTINHNKDAEEDVDDDILIRPFGTTEWVEPTLENMRMGE